MTDHAARLPRYKELRQKGLALNNRLLKFLTKDVMDEGGKKLGMLRKNTLVLDSEDLIAVFADYCIHDVRRQGKNAIERMLAEAPPPAESDEMLLLQAWRTAYYSLFVIEAAVPGVGVHVRDVLRDERVFLMDVGFSQTARPGDSLAGRMFCPDGIWMSTGASLPFGAAAPGMEAKTIRALQETFGPLDFRNLPPETAAELSARLIRTCLQRGAGERIRYRDPDENARMPSPATPRSAAPPSRRRIGRNDPCRCGSGRKFKHCCGRR